MWRSLGLLILVTLVSFPADAFVQPKAGRFEHTERVTDLAIIGGGFLVLLEEGRSEFVYTRFGNLSLDGQGRLADRAGRLALGFDPNATDPETDPLVPIDLSDPRVAPGPTSRIVVNVNLDPDDEAIPGGPAGFDHTAPVNTANFQIGVRVFDSLGVPHVLLIYFRKDDSTVNSWFWYAGVNRAEVDFIAYGAPFSTFATRDVTLTQFFPIQSGTLSFSAVGALITEATGALAVSYDSDGDQVADTLPIPTPGNAAGWAFSDGASPFQFITYDFGTTPSEGGNGLFETTQFRGWHPSGLNSFLRWITQDGFTSGSLTEIEITAYGAVVGTFTNGQSRPLARFGLARFLGETRLERIGEHELVETPESGPPFFGFPGEGGFGTVASGWLEIIEDSPLDRCLAGERPEPDLDGDGRITGDLCANTPPGVGVDSDGCSLEQFCEGIEVREPRDALRCIRSDWKNDEPLRRYPRDCGFTRDPSGGGWRGLLCTAR